MHWYEREGLNLEKLISIIRHAELFQAKDIHGNDIGRQIAQWAVHPGYGVNVLFFAGDPGSGKSTLTWEVADIALNAGRKVNVISYSYFYRLRYDSLPIGVDEISDEQRMEVSLDMFNAIRFDEFNIIDSPVHGDNVERGGEILRRLSNYAGLEVVDVIGDPRIQRITELTRVMSQQCTSGYQFEDVMYQMGIPVILPSHALDEIGWEKNGKPFYRKTATMSMIRSFEKEIRRAVKQVESDPLGNMLIRNYSEDVYWDDDFKEIGSAELAKRRKIIGYKRGIMYHEMNVSENQYHTLVNKIIKEPRFCEIPNYDEGVMAT